MARKKVKRKVDNLDKERSEEILASNSEWDVSNTLNYLQHIVNNIWLIWVYIKIILKLVTFLFIKTKSQNDEIASSVKTDDGPGTTNWLIYLLKRMISFFVSSESFLFDFINPFDVSLVDEICSVCKKDGFILVLLYYVALALVKTVIKLNKETSSELNMDTERDITVDKDKTDYQTKKGTKEVKLTDILKTSKCKQQSDCQTLEFLQKMQGDMTKRTMSENITTNKIMEEREEIKIEAVPRIVSTCPPAKICWSCLQSELPLLKCGGCRKARYCGEECYREDWERHGEWCRRRREKREEKKVKKEGTKKNGSWSMETEVD